MSYNSRYAIVKDLIRLQVLNLFNNHNASRIIEMTDPPVENIDKI